MELLVAFAHSTSGWSHVPAERDLLLVICGLSPVLSSLLSICTFVTSFDPLNHCKEDSVPISQRRVRDTEVECFACVMTGWVFFTLLPPYNLRILKQKLNLEE